MKLRSIVLLIITGCIFSNLNTARAFITQTEGQSTAQLSVVSAVAPAYPPEVVSKGYMGAVIIEVQVDDKGIVKSASAISGPPLLYQVAKAAAQRWIFSPDKNHPEIRKARLSFNFKLVAEGIPVEEMWPVFKVPFEVEIKAIQPSLRIRQTSMQ